MTAYLLHLAAKVDLTPRKAAEFEAALDYMTSIVTSFGGSFVTRMGDLQGLHGELDANRISLIEFPSMADLRAFYFSDAYRPFASTRIGEVLAFERDERP